MNLKTPEEAGLNGPVCEFVDEVSQAAYSGKVKAMIAVTVSDTGEAEIHMNGDVFDWAVLGGMDVIKGIIVRNLLHGGE